MSLSLRREQSLPSLALLYLVWHAPYPWVNCSLALLYLVWHAPYPWVNCSLALLYLVLRAPYPWVNWQVNCSLSQMMWQNIYKSHSSAASHCWRPFVGYLVLFCKHNAYFAVPLVLNLTDVNIVSQSNNYSQATIKSKTGCYNKSLPPYMPP